MFRVLTKVTKDSPSCKIFEYKIEFRDEERVGDAVTFIQLVKTLTCQMSGIPKLQYYNWLKRGFAKEDFFACLDDFYPNGRRLSGAEDFLRKGVGESVLSMLLDDLKKYSPKFIYCTPTNENSKAFFTAMGWISDYKNKKIMYKLF